MIVGFWACKPCKSGAGRNYSASVKGDEFTQNRCGGGLARSLIVAACLCSLSIAQDSSENNATRSVSTKENPGAQSSAVAINSYKFPEIVVVGNIDSSLTSVGDSYGGTQKIGRTMIESMPSGNGDFVQLLRTNPNVQFSSTNRQSTTLGEISPANISINGAKYWQNNFMLDGANMNNDLDPARNPGGNPTRFSAFDTMNSVSQGMAIDSDFLRSVEVHDSGVSAKYGGFTGGVVEAKTRDPRAGFHGKFSMQHTEDSWTRYHIYGDEQSFENSATPLNQPRFDKWITRLNLEGTVTEDLGLMFGYTNTRSKIPLKAYDRRYNADTTITERVQRRNIDNYFLKALWYASDRLTITPSVTYAPERNKMFNDHVKDSYADMKSGGLNLALKTDYDGDFARFNQILSYSKLESSRDAENEYYRAWQYSNVKNWGSKILSAAAIEGGYGDLDQTQKSFSYNADLEFNEFDLGGSKHRFITGFEFKKQEAKFNVKKEFMTASGIAPLPAGVNACDPDDELCSIDDSFARRGRSGQFFTRKSYYKGNTKVDMKSLAVYLEDEIKIGDLTLRPGVRLNRDDYMKQTTAAPRFNSYYDIFSDGDSILSFGANRYYGRNLFTYKLREGREGLATTYTRPRNAYTQNWTQLPKDPSLTKFNELKVPYEDELVFGAKQKLGNFEFFGKYVSRKGRDQIIKSTRRDLGLAPNPNYQNNYQTFTNDGRSENKILTFGVKTIDDYEAFGTLNGFELGFEHIKMKTNNTLYDISLDRETLEDEKIVEYDGRLMRLSELPAQDYARPWTASLNIITKIPSYGISVNNFLSFKGSQEAIARTGRTPAGKYPARYDKYEKVNLGKSYSWDARIGYAKKMAGEVEFFTNLDIYNVLNKRNKARLSSDTSLDLVYEAGRQFWLEAGIRW